MIQTDIDYPDGLPHPLREGKTTRHVQPFLRTTMESGRARQRRRFTSVPSIGTYRFIFTDTQAAAFELWFKTALKDGTEWFNMPRRTPLGQSVLVCRFTGMYEGPDEFGLNMWTISAEMESWERPLLPDEWDLLPDFVVHADIFDMAMNREWPEA